MVFRICDLAVQLTDSIPGILTTEETAIETSILQHISIWQSKNSIKVFKIFYLKVFPYTKTIYSLKIAPSD